MTRAPARATSPKPASASPAVPVVPSAADPMDLVAEVAEAVPAMLAPAEYILLSPGVTTESISRVLTSDKPLGFEDMALEAQGKPLLAAAPDPVAEPVAPSTNEAGISSTMLERTSLEQEAGRVAVARRTAESVRNREITARENAKRQAEGSAAQAGDLSYNGNGQ